MHDPHKYPNYIFTNELAISHILISHQTSQVTVLGCYYDMLYGGMPTICLETDFASLNDLLSELGEDAEDAIDQISKCLVEPSGEVSIIDLSNEGGISISGYLFSFVLMDEEENRMIREEQWTYRVVGCIARDEILPDFSDCIMPENVNERLTYLSSLIAIQYHFYLTYREKMADDAAIIYANLDDPLYFNLAKTIYELQIAGQTK
jgi:hypothetical protein